MVNPQIRRLIGEAVILSLKLKLQLTEITRLWMGLTMQDCLVGVAGSRIQAVTGLVFVPKTQSS